MASPVVQEFATLLQSLRNLKPPGVNKSKVEAITKIATSNENQNVRLKYHPSYHVPSLTELPILD